ncbi:ATP-binding cassette domain-containing protein [Corynebacterium rhinophilum]|uniref:ATP-binding cassette domain-containing protein n=1 Tax=Corynebacterium rhinophilum TaxID=3050197 RepID=UPI00397D03BF
MSDPLITSRTAITASNLTVGYARNTPILENIDVELPKGKVTTIVGPNGCGKSTLLRSLARLLPIESGTVMGQVRWSGVSVLPESVNRGTVSGSVLGSGSGLMLVH